MSDQEPQDTQHDAPMPFMEHLLELRRRLMWAVLAVVIAFLGCYAVAQDIYHFLTLPLVEKLGDRSMIATGLVEPFFTYVKLAFWAGAFLAFPIIAAQIWLFVAPGLYKDERKAFAPFLIATPILFFIGGAMAYYIIFPLAWEFFLAFENPDMRFELRISEYLSLVMSLIFAFGISFLLPVLLTLLAKVGLTSSTALAAKRKYAVLLVFVAAAVLTPPDPVSQISLAVPLLLLYEASIIMARLVEKKKA